VFVIFSPFHPSLFGDKARAYLTRVEVTDSDKHPSLSRNEINYRRKQFYSTGPRCFNTRVDLEHFKAIMTTKNKSELGDDLHGVKIPDPNPLFNTPQSFSYQKIEFSG